MSTVRFASNEEKAIGGIVGLIILQFKIVWWIIKGIIRIVTFGIAWHKAHNPEPLGIPEESRFEHTLVLAGSGHGKTQTLQHMLALDIPEVAKGNCSVVVIDSQGDMIKNLLRLKELAPSQFEVATPPPPEVVTVEPPQQHVAEAVPARRNTVLRYIWHVCLVFLILIALTAVGTITVLTVKLPHELYAFIIITPIALITGALLRRQKNPPSFLSCSISAAAFLAFTYYLDPQALTIYESRGTVASLMLGFDLMHLVGVAAKPTKPMESVENVNPAQSSTLADGLIYIDPTDIYNPPALNLFDFGLDRIAEYDAVEQERMLNGAVAMYEYVFGALLGAIPFT